MSTSDFWIFRDQRGPVRAAQLVDEVQRLTRRALHSQGDDAADAVISAGKLECGLADANAPSAQESAKLTDVLALNLLLRNQDSLRRVLARLEQLEVPDTLTVSQPEGFSYYALHPRDFSDVADSLPHSSRYAVVGIRSVGTTLSAMIAARILLRGESAERMSVRPSGHPYDRTLQLTSEQKAWVQRQRDIGSQFVIADEGPGRSGSTFLSVAEALREAGVPSQRMVLAGSHRPSLTSLCAHNAEERWRDLNFVAAKRWACAPYTNLTYLGGGEWRRFLLAANEHEWPACWPQMERLKFLSADGKQIIKFEGLSTHGEDVRARAQCLAEAGFGPRCEGSDNGFLRYRRLAGAEVRSKDLTRADLERLAEYCAFRRRHFQCERSCPSQLPDMVAFNLSVEFGCDFQGGEELATESPLITDSRMAPHEWIRDEKGRLIKTDGVSHGDDHFFPGPVDIAWDLAGAAIEWELSAEAEMYLLAIYRRQTRDNARARLLTFKIAYAIFRLGSCRMALPTTQDTMEEARLRAEIERYRNHLFLLLADVTEGRPRFNQAA